MTKADQTQRLQQSYTSLFKSKIKVTKQPLQKKIAKNRLQRRYHQGTRKGKKGDRKEWEE